MKSLCATALLALSSCGSSSDEPAFRRFAKPLAGAEWTGAVEAPKNVTWKTRLDGPEEAGDPLIVTGTVFKPDGKTPAPGVLIYVYHTDHTGHYSRGSGNGNGPRHGKLRGWMLTGADGKYEFRTVRAAPYPGRTAEAHIHVTLTADGFPEHWTDEFLFHGDPLIPARIQAKSDGLGKFAFVMKLHKGDDGVWHGHRDLRLEPPSRTNGGR